MTGTIACLRLNRRYLYYALQHTSRLQESSYFASFVCVCGAFSHSRCGHAGRLISSRLGGGGAGGGQHQGTTWRGRTMLHAEEGLWLAERGMLTVQPFSNSGTSPPPAAAPSRASVASSEGDGQAGPRSSRPATAEEMGEQHRGENEKGDKIARGRIGAGVGCPTGAGERERKEDEEEEEVVVGQRSDDCSDGSSTAKADPPPSSTAGETTLSRIGLSTKRNFSGRAPAGNAEEVLDSGGPGGLASGAQGHGRRKRGGCKRGRSGSGGSERDGGSAPALSMSIEDLHASILPRAGVPWECYRAYAELKRR